MSDPLLQICRLEVFKTTAVYTEAHTHPATVIFFQGKVGYFGKYNFHVLEQVIWKV